jgi:two-component system sensor histidine kinase UhpB
MITRHGKLLILLMTTCAVAIMGAIWWYYQRQHIATEEAAREELTAIAQFKTLQIANWRRERIGDGRVLLSSPVMEVAHKILSNAQPMETERSLISSVFTRMQREFLYSDATLADLDGSVRIRAAKQAIPSDNLKKRSRKALVRQAVTTGDAVLSDLTKETRDHRPLLSVAIPVKSEGAIILEIDPATFLYPYLQSWPTHSESAETILFRREPGDEFVILNPLRNDSRSAFEIRRAVTSFGPVPDDADLTTGWYAKRKNYRGIPVISVVRQIPDSPWYVSVQVAQFELEAPMTRLSWEVAALCALIAAANGAGVALIWRNQQLQAYRDRESWFQAIANETPAFLWFSSSETQKSFINKPLGRLIGVSEELLGADWANHIHPDDQVDARNSYLQSQAARREYACEFRIRRSDGEYRWVLSQGVPRFSAKAELVGYAGSLLDITDLRNTEARLRSTNEALVHELEERTRAEQEVQALNARLIRAQEEERTRVAGELHDDISQQIAALSIGLGILRKTITDPAALSQTDRIRERLVQLAQSTRRLSHELHPAVLEHSGLTAALRDHCRELSSLTSHRIRFHSDGDCDILPPDAVLCVYRVAQEALQNSIKHARVEGAEVELTRTEDSVWLVVSDKGIGIDASLPAGLGLLSMQQRTRMVNGTLEIASTPDRGVTITLKAPVPVSGQGKTALG